MAKPRSFQQFTPFLESGSGLRSSSKEGGGRVYKGVTIIKAGLGNRKDKNFYPSEAIKHAVESGMFEGLKAYADHPTSVDEQIQPERTVRDFVGIYSNTRFKEDNGKARAVGDLRVLKAHSWLADVIDELIEVGMPDKIGISINGSGQTSPAHVREAGEELEVNRVNRFHLLRSADIVTEAGAGGGFQEVLESARFAKENTMSRKQLLQALTEAAEAKDLDQVKQLSAQLAASDGADETDEEADVTPKSKKRIIAKAEEAEDEGDEDVDGDDDDGDEEELDEAVAEAKRRVPADEEDDQEEDDEDAMAEAALGECGCETGTSEAEEDPTRRAVRKFKQHQTKENVITGYGKRKGKNLKGVPSGGAGSFTKNEKSGGAGPSGRRYAEAEEAPVGSTRIDLLAENQRLREKLARKQARNDRLAEALTTYTRADMARKLLRQSEIPAELQPKMVGRLVRMPTKEAMQHEIDFQTQLLESAASKAREALTDGDEYDSIEGNGARFRESYGEGEQDDVISVFNEAGLPLKSTK